MTAEAMQQSIARIWKHEAARIIGGLVRIVRDVSLAEELAQDALVAALEQWPVSGLPHNPAAWLTTTARNRAFTSLRRTKLAHQTGEAIAQDSLHGAEPLTPLTAVEAAMDDDVGDDVLRLVFIACHPVLSKEARVALTLRMVGGLTTRRSARAARPVRRGPRRVHARLTARDQCPSARASPRAGQGLRGRLTAQIRPTDCNQG